MNTDNLEFNIRLATKNDLGALTELHCNSFTPEDHVPVILGEEYVRATYRWQVIGDQAYTLVAEKNGEIIGLIAVCDGPFTFPMFMACIPQFIKALVKKPSTLFNKKLWQRLLRRPDLSETSKKIADYPDFAQMTIGAVDKNCRGYGVFPALVEATKGYSIKRGSRAIRAGIYKENMPSRKVFIKGNWIETPELESTDTVFYVAYLDTSFPKELGIIP